MCMCVRDRQTDRQTDRQRERKKERKSKTTVQTFPGLTHNYSDFLSACGMGSVKSVADVDEIGSENIHYSIN